MLKWILQAVILIMLVSPSWAQDWVVTRVRGTAEQQADGRWIELVRGAVVQDQQSVRTGPDGRVGLARGAETIELDPGTSILLNEGAGKLTSIRQISGVVTVDVERRNVQHFSVQTPFLAAVVKGTRFKVSVTDTAALVDVERGTVQVQDTGNDLVVDITHGQEAAVSRSEPLTVSGPGQIAVFTFDGLHIVNGTVDTPADNSGKSADSANTTTPASAPNSNGNAKGNTGAHSNGNGNGSGNSGSSNGNSNSNGNGNGAVATQKATAEMATAATQMATEMATGTSDALASKHSW